MIVAPGAVVGRTPSVPLEIDKGADLNFDVLWWADEERTELVDMSEAAAQVRDDENNLLLDLAPTVDGGRVMVRVSAEVTAAVEYVGYARWDLEVVAAGTGERRKLAKGSVRFFEEVTS